MIYFTSDNMVPSESDRFAAAEARLPTDEELLSTEEEPTDWYREVPLYEDVEPIRTVHRDEID